MKYCSPHAVITLLTHYYVHALYFCLLQNSLLKRKKKRPISLIVDCLSFSCFIFAHDKIYAIIINDYT